MVSTCVASLPRMLSPIPPYEALPPVKASTNGDPVKPSPSRTLRCSVSRLPGMVSLHPTKINLEMLYKHALSLIPVMAEQVMSEQASTCQVSKPEKEVEHPVPAWLSAPLARVPPWSHQDPAHTRTTAGAWHVSPLGPAAPAELPAPGASPWALVPAFSSAHFPLLLAGWNQKKQKIMLLEMPAVKTFKKPFWAAP